MGGCCGCLKVILDNETADIRINVIEPTIIPQDLVSAISNVPYGTRLSVPRSSIKNNNI
uniref:HMA domain-containing protein n=1 Tax=Meloidogyne incognita TaxID=6306 RepID=A0A914L7F3_MELIC